MKELQFDWDIYLSGPISNNPEKNIEAFKQAAAALRAKGYKVFTPPEGEVPGHAWHEYMRRDIGYLVKCASIVMLPGWQESKGATMEYELASRLKLPIYSLGDVLDPRVTQLQFTPERKSLYVIGSLANPYVTKVANGLRQLGIDVFDDWMAAGPDADKEWQRYEISKGHSYKEAIQGHAARHVFDYDKQHLDRASAGLLVLPAGKSAHLELGYLIGQGKPGYVLFDGEPTRYDVMYQFASELFFSIGALHVWFNRNWSADIRVGNGEGFKPLENTLGSGYGWPNAETVSHTLNQGSPALQPSELDESLRPGGAG